MDRNQVTASAGSLAVRRRFLQICSMVILHLVCGAGSLNRHANYSHPAGASQSTRFALDRASRFGLGGRAGFDAGLFTT